MILGIDVLWFVLIVSLVVLSLCVICFVVYLRRRPINSQRVINFSAPHELKGIDFFYEGTVFTVSALRIEHCHELRERINNILHLKSTPADLTITKHDGTTMEDHQLIREFIKAEDVEKTKETPLLVKRASFNINCAFPFLVPVGKTSWGGIPEENCCFGISPGVRVAKTHDHAQHGVVLECDPTGWISVSWDAVTAKPASLHRWGFNGQFDVIPVDISHPNPPTLPPTTTYVYMSRVPLPNSEDTLPVDKPVRSLGELTKMSVLSKLTPPIMTPPSSGETFSTSTASISWVAKAEKESSSSSLSSTSSSSSSSGSTSSSSSSSSDSESDSSSPDSSSAATPTLPVGRPPIAPLRRARGGRVVKASKPIRKDKSSSSRNSSSSRKSSSSSKRSSSSSKKTSSSSKGSSKSSLKSSSITGTDKTTAPTSSSGNTLSSSSSTRSGSQTDSSTSLSVTKTGGTVSSLATTATGKGTTTNSNSSSSTLSSTSSSGSGSNSNSNSSSSGSNSGSGSSSGSGSTSSSSGSKSPRLSLGKQVSPVPQQVEVLRRVLSVTPLLQHPHH